MGFWSNLLKKMGWPKSSCFLEADPQLVSFDDSFLHVPSLSYFGFYEISKSNEWVISWLDSDRKNHTGGHRESGYGQFILYNKLTNKIVMTGKLERPNHGHVANTGIFSIEDWMFGGGLKSTFYVISTDGEVVIERHFEANLYNSAISSNGILAVCQTANAKSEDGNKLTAFNISTGLELFSISPETGWADSYEFDEYQGHVIVVHNRVGKLRYDLKGIFLDKEKFEKDKLVSKDYVVILLTVEQKLKQKDSSHEELNHLLEAVSRAKSLQTDNPNGWDSIAFKLEGLIFEKLGKLDKAVFSYKKALALNPKVGVVRRLASLQRKLEQSHG